jgi:hypothetical protein
MASRASATTDAPISSNSESIDLSASEEELKAQFGRTATPTQRIHLWLDEIETSASAVQADIDATLSERQQTADAAARRYYALRARGLPEDSEELRQAAEDFCDTANAVRPPVWLAAREALLNAGLVRECLAGGTGDEAVEAALRAVNAWWRMRTLQFEKPIRYGFEGLKARSEGGKKRAAHLAEENLQRDVDIRQTYEAIRATREHGRAEIIKLLATRFDLSPKQIRRILPRDTN